jgi:hypothetical protein
VFSLKRTMLKFVETSVKENALTSDSQARLPLDNQESEKGGLSYIKRMLHLRQRLP